jgi:hypothetical protein
VRWLALLLLLVGCGKSRVATDVEAPATTEQPEAEVLECPEGTEQSTQKRADRRELATEVCGVRIYVDVGSETVTCQRPDGTQHGPFLSTWPLPRDGRTLVFSRGVYTRTIGACDEGTPAGTWRHYLRGQLLLESEYEGGRLDGFWREWYESGSPRVIGHYRHGRPWGVWSYWDRSGRKTTKTRILRGSNEGVY